MDQLDVKETSQTKPTAKDLLPKDVTLGQYLVL